MICSRFTAIIGKDQLTGDGEPECVWVLSEETLQNCGFAGARGA